MILAALISTLVLASPSAPLGVKTARAATSLDWASLPAKDPQGQPQRLAIELRLNKMLPMPFPVHVRIQRARLPASPPRLMLLREVDEKGQARVRTACQWDSVNERIAELTWFVPSGSGSVLRFVLDFAPAATDVVISMQRDGGKYVYEARNKATYVLNPAGARIEKLEVASLSPPNVATGQGFDIVPGTESKTFKLVHELNGPLCYRLAALSDGKLVKRLTLYAGIFWHETEVHGQPAKLIHHTIEIGRALGTSRSSGSYRKDGLLIGVASIGGPAKIASNSSGFTVRAPGPFAGFLTFVGFDDRTISLVTLERLVIASDTMASAEAVFSVVR